MNCTRSNLVRQVPRVLGSQVHCFAAWRQM